MAHAGFFLQVEARWAARQLFAMPAPSASPVGRLDTKQISSWCRAGEGQEPLVSECDRNGRREPLAFREKAEMCDANGRRFAICRPDPTSLWHFNGSA
jgi:hypothetical protein